MPNFSQAAMNRITRVVQYVERLMRERPQDTHREARNRELFNFQLTSNLSAGGSAFANRIEWDPVGMGWVPVQEGIQVFDDLYGNLEAIAGARGRFYFTAPDRRCIDTVRCN